MNASEASFQKVLLKNPALCMMGMVSAESGKDRRIDFEGERRRLEGAFDEFAFCCDWLLDCTPLKRVSFVAPPSNILAPHIEKKTGRLVSNGALIAAVLHMRIPFHPLPGSPDVLVGISLRSPTLADLELPKRGRKGDKG
jgi:hypothetical protein